MRVRLSIFTQSGNREISYLFAAMLALAPWLWCGQVAMGSTKTGPCNPTVSGGVADSVACSGGGCTGVRTVTYSQSGCNQANTNPCESHDVNVQTDFPPKEIFLGWTAMAGCLGGSWQGWVCGVCILAAAAGCATGVLCPWVAGGCGVACVALVASVQCCWTSCVADLTLPTHVPGGTSCY